MTSRERARPIVARLLRNARAGIVMFIIEVGIVAAIGVLGLVLAWLLLLAV